MRMDPIQHEIAQEKTNAGVVHPMRIGIWIAFAAAFAFLYYRYSGSWGEEITGLAQSSALLAYAIYVVLGAVRGFALIPVTNLVVLAIPIFPPWPLLVLTLVGIAISSASIYAFAGSLGLARHFERKHARSALRASATPRRS